MRPTIVTLLVFASFTSAAPRLQPPPGYYLKFVKTFYFPLIVLTSSVDPYYSTGETWSTSGSNHAMAASPLVVVPLPQAEANQDFVHPVEGSASEGEQTTHQEGEIEESSNVEYGPMRRPASSEVHEGAPTREEPDKATNSKSSPLTWTSGDDGELRRYKSAFRRL